MSIYRNIRLLFQLAILFPLVAIVLLVAFLTATSLLSKTEDDPVEIVLKFEVGEISAEEVRFFQIFGVMSHDTQLAQMAVSNYFLFAISKICEDGELGEGEKELLNPLIEASELAEKLNFFVSFEFKMLRWASKCPVAQQTERFQFSKSDPARSLYSFH